MHEREGVVVPLGRKMYLEDGSQAIAERKKRKLARYAGNTAIHEIKHSYVQEVLIPNSVEGASIKPGPGYLGITRVSRVHEAAAAAPHADGMSGTGGDTSTIERMGGNLSAACSVARSIMAGKEEIIYEAACDLEERKTMDGNEIRSSFEEAENGGEVVLFLVSPAGKKQELSSLQHIGIHKTRNNLVYVPLEKLSLPEAA